MASDIIKYTKVQIQCDCQVHVLTIQIGYDGVSDLFLTAGAHRCLFVTVTIEFLRLQNETNRAIQQSTLVKSCSCALAFIFISLILQCLLCTHSIRIVAIKRLMQGVCTGAAERHVREQHVPRVRRCRGCARADARAFPHSSSAAVSCAPRRQVQKVSFIHHLCLF